VFSIKNLSVSINKKSLLSSVTLICPPGSITVLMGPNGSGKSSLANALMGHPAYEITAGALTLNGTNLIPLLADKRAQAGLFLAFQYPYEIPGVSVLTFLKEAYRSLGNTEISITDFIKKIETAFEQVGLPAEYMYRSLHEGFSGGERKRLEVAQLLLLQPKVALLDEIDSGLDIDGIQQVAQALLYLKNKNPETIFIIITHTIRLLNYLSPDIVHILVEGKIVTSGNAQLLTTLETQGYKDFIP
jgi:Fe-S cluster assembly ATP-binding protein